jgi:hypothetical protein
MRILNIVTSPRRERSASIAIVDLFHFEYQKKIKGLVVDTSPCAAATPARPATSIALPPSGGIDRGEGWIVVPATRRKRSSCDGFPSPNSKEAHLTYFQNSAGGGRKHAGQTPSISISATRMASRFSIFATRAD